jgi:hypothetical protein
MIPHDPDRNITMPHGTGRDYLSIDENDINQFSYLKWWFAFTLVFIAAIVFVR